VVEVGGFWWMGALFEILSRLVNAALSRGYLEYILSLIMSEYWQSIIADRMTTKICKLKSAGVVAEHSIYTLVIVSDSTA
jgi:hypothetical protein